MKGTGLLMLLCALMTGLALGQRDPLRLLRWGALNSGLVESGQIWRLGSHLFLQDGPLALLLCLVTLLILGRHLPALFLFTAGGLAGVPLAYGPFATGGWGGVGALLGAALVRERSGPAVGLLLLNAGAAWWWGTWPQAAAGAVLGVVVGMLWRAELPAACAAVVALPLACLLPALGNGLTWQGVAGYPVTTFHNGTFTFQHSVLLRAREDQASVALAGPGVSVFVSHEATRRQLSARQLGREVPANQRLLKVEEDETADRIWQRLTLEQGVLLRTVQGHQLVTLGLLASPRTPVAEAEPLLSQVEDSLKLNVPPAQVEAQRKFEDAMLQIAQNQLPAAIVTLTQTLQLEPRFAEALFQRGFLRQGQGQRQAALADYDEAARLDPNDPRPLLNRAILRIESGQLAPARPDLDQTLELAAAAEGGLRFEAYNARAWVRANLGDPAGGLEDADAALALRAKPDVAAQAHDTRGFALEALHRYPEALAAYAEAQKQNYPDAFLHAGELLWRQHDPAARPLLQRFLELEPGRSEAGRVRRELK